MSAKHEWVSSEKRRSSGWVECKRCGCSRLYDYQPDDYQPGWPGYYTYFRGENYSADEGRIEPTCIDAEPAIDGAIALLGWAPEGMVSLAPLLQGSEGSETSR